MRLLRVVIGSVAVACLASAISCSTIGDRSKSSDEAKSRGSLIGKWVSADGQETIEFTADGKFRAQLKYDGMEPQIRALSGTYFTDGAKISFTANGELPMIWEYDRKGNDITFTYVKGGMVKMDGSMARFSPQP